MTDKSAEERVDVRLTQEAWDTILAWMGPYLGASQAIIEHESQASKREVELLRELLGYSVVLLDNTGRAKDSFVPSRVIEVELKRASGQAVAARMRANPPTTAIAPKAVRK